MSEKVTRPGLLGRLPAPNRYGLALALVVLAIVTSALADQGAWAKVLALVFQGGALLFIFAAAEVKPRLVLVARWTVLGGVVLGSFFAVFGSDTVATLALAIVGTLMAVVAPFAVIRRLRRETSITIHVAMGVLLIYLLIGMFFVFVYELIDRVMATQFFVQTQHPQSVDFTYFSYVTLATLGYGDFTAASDLGKMLSVAEALIGQLYLVSIVALVIGGLGGVRKMPRTSDAEQDGDVTPPAG
ncbi:MAG: ion channel [Actinomycetota bacterium]